MMLRLPLTLLLFPILVPAATPQNYTRAVIRTGGDPGVRYHSGLTVCDEALFKGHWTNRYWLATGMVAPEHHLGNSKDAAGRFPTDSFQLSLEGRDLAGTWKWIKAYQEPAETPYKGQLVTVELESSVQPVEVKVRTLLTGGPVMMRWLEVVNRGKKSTAISAVSPWSGPMWDTSPFIERIEEGSTPFELAYAEYEQWGQEGAWRFVPLENGTSAVSGTRGKSGWGHPTFFARNRATGEWFVASLAWSGNWKMSLTGMADRTEDSAGMFFSLGPAAADPALRVIDPGETVKTPETHVLVMAADLDRVIQALHEHVRENVILPPIAGREYQVESNHRGYIVDHEDEAGLKREVDLAAEAGAEEFLIDAGWYGPEPNQWANNVGDWYAGKWLPNDITPVREHARKKGLLFGLWVEIEGVGANSLLRKQHPDWIMTRNGEPVGKGRMLDFSKPEVAAWAESEIARIIQKYDLDMFRIDYNTTIQEGGNRVKEGFTENTLWRHVEALYAMFDRIHQRFPKVILQNCAGGGGRLDLGMLHRFHNTELSDWMRGPRNVKILNGMTWILPPEILLRTFGTEVGGIPNDGDLDQQLRLAMICRPIFRGLSPTLEDFNPIVREKIRSAVESFKREVRPVMIGSRVYHHTPLVEMMKPTPWVVLEYAAPDASRSIAAFFRTSHTGDSTFAFRPRGIDVGRSYRVRFGNSGQSVTIPGERLLQSGIPVRIENAMGSEVLFLDESR